MKLKTEFLSALVIAALFSLIASQPANGQTATTETTQDTAGGFTADEFAAKLDAFIAKALELELSPGLAVAVVKDGEVLYVAGHGLADLETERRVTADTVFYIASSTKSYTGLAASLLHERGELDLDASLGDYLPTAKLQAPLSADGITLKQLLTHTHGIANAGPLTFRCAYTGEFTSELLVELLNKNAAAETGTQFQYGNIGYNVASMAMDEKLQQGWKDVLAAEIFGPLGMESTTGYVSRMPQDRLAMPYRIESAGFGRLPYGKSDGNMHAAGGLVTTAKDVSRWLLANMNDGQVAGEQLVPAAAFQTAHTKFADQDGAYGPFSRSGYGLGWNIGEYDGDAFTHHFGGFGGFHAHIGFMPEHNIGVAVLANSSQGSIVADLVARFTYDTLLEKPGTDEKMGAALDQYEQLATQARGQIAADRERRATRSQELNRPLSAYVGTYENADYGQVTFSIANNKLEFQMGAATSPVEVYDADRDALRIEVGGGGRVAVFSFSDGDTADSVQTDGMTFTRVKEE